MKIPLMLLLVLSLVFGLCGCHQHTWEEATCTEPKTCSKCGETEGEPLGHTWVDATYHEPKTCSVCGETEGDPQISAFEKYNIPVTEELNSFSCKRIYAIDESYQPTSADAKYTFKSYTIKPSSRSNYKTIKIAYEIVFEEPGNSIDSLTSAGRLYDYYTGHMFSSRGGDGNYTYELFDSVAIDEKEYTVYYTRDIVWDESQANENNMYSFKATVTYEIDVPEGYDGLVLRFEDITEFASDEDYEIHTEQLSESDSAGYNLRFVDP